jgi:tRNA threonylcarbamoyl adenosine modification protein YjeE
MDAPWKREDSSVAKPEIIKHTNFSEEALAALAANLAPRLRPGDFLALHGDLGAGKTVFARSLIRALTGNAEEEVPSPTFALVQPYETPRFPIHHFDFYRLAGTEEIFELGLNDALASGIVIAEWPERLADQCPNNRLAITLIETSNPDLRDITFEGLETWGQRIERLAAVNHFLTNAGWGEGFPTYVNGDASTRSYTRLTDSEKRAILMDWPKGPDGPPIRDNRPYSQIAHLAEDVKPFVAISGALRKAGLGAPEIYAADFAQGFLLMEDLGDDVFTAIAACGDDIRPAWHLAVDALLALRSASFTPELEADAINHRLPHYDHEALTIETELLLDWFLPAINGVEVSASARTAFLEAWAEQFDWLATQPTGWVLRDYHSPNLLITHTEEGRARLGILDFQDALCGHAAYDLVSLLQDARLDLPEGLEAELLTYYCTEAARHSSFDKAAFLRAYHLLGAQRNTKILGIFARLARRDGKRGYLRHMPRIARYLMANLADPALTRLRDWYSHEIPHNIGKRIFQI